MRLIFNECVTLFSARDGTNQEQRVVARVLGHYGNSEGVLCVDLSCAASVGGIRPMQEPPTARRVLETVKDDDEAAAIRHTIALMDEWKLEVAKWAEVNGPKLCRDPNKPVL